MIVHKVFDSDTQELLIPAEVLPEESGRPYSHHFLSTPGDNLIELAGRVCYDSCKQLKTRNSIEYHKHINEVKHGSVQQHCSYGIKIYPRDMLQLVDLLLELSNRPGVFYTFENNELNISFNIRSANEWEKHGIIQGDIKNIVREVALQECPLACSFINIQKPAVKYSKIKSPTRFISYYIAGVSRGLTHEMVRHHYQTAISQRSTRYVDESESDWIWHPLINKYRDKLDIPISDFQKAYQYYGISPFCITGPARMVYKQIQVDIKNLLIKDGVDKFTASKQANGAARGVLGNSLSTELIFTASIEEWRHFILNRANDGADAEIRLLANKVYEDLLSINEPLIFNLTIGKGSKDGIGYEIIGD